jgi:hypothetical protein
LFSEHFSDQSFFGRVDPEVGGGQDAAQLVVAHPAGEGAPLAAECLLAPAPAPGSR